MSLQDDETRISQPNLPQYKYAPLKSPRSIRIFLLHSAESYESPIRIQLVDVSLDDCLPFLALSYAWATEDGDSSLTKSIACAPDDDELYIHVTTNCDAALRRIRAHSGDEGNILWVDAICIDQNNIEEKNIQVPLMKDIYKIAQRVALWIGEASEEVDPESSRPITDLGMEFIVKFGQELQERKERGQDAIGGDCYQEVLAFHQREEFSLYVLGLWMILQRGWWKRVWVVQEVALPNSVGLLCGAQLISFHMVEHVLDALVKDHPGLTPEEHEFNINLISKALPHFTMRMYMKSASLQPKIDVPTTDAALAAKVLYILTCTSQARASDPRDQIYGILGFFGDAGTDPENILPRADYNKSTADVYADVTRAIILQTRSLDLMCDSYGSQQTNLGLPSWAKSFDHTTPNYYDKRGFNAANDSLVVYEDCADNLAFRIQGKRVDTLKEVIDLPSNEFEYGDVQIVTMWREWRELAFSIQTYPTGEEMGRVFMETLCWSSNGLENRLQPGEYQAGFDAFLAILTSDESVEGASKAIFEDKTALPYSRRARRILLGRLLAKTSTDYLALVPLMTLPGDHIVVFSGGTIPFVVREEAAGRFRLIGSCYVHGIMDGQAFPKEDGGEKLEWFTLR